MTGENGQGDGLRHPGAGERFEPLPGLMRLPGFLLDKLPRRWRAAALAALALAALAVAASVPLLDLAAEKRADRARAVEAERIAAERARLDRDQRVQRAWLSTPERRALRRAAARLRPTGAPGDPPALVPTGVTAALERAITADVVARVAAGELAKGVQATECEPFAVTATAVKFSCIAFHRRDRLRLYHLTSGYRFRARAFPSSGALVWCKQNHRPLHPATQGHVVVPLPTTCTGR